MLKRVTYLEKRADLSTESFCAHWAGIHAEIAKDLPGVACYLQNHVRRSSSLGDGSAYRVDGIVELWFRSAEVVSAASDGLVADRLAADETKFLRGLTGGPVAAQPPHDPWPYKLWVLGLRHEGIADADLLSLARQMHAVIPGVVGSEVNLLEENPLLLRRPALRSEARIPEVAVVFGFADADAAETALEAITGPRHNLRSLLDNVHLYLAAEVIIVPVENPS